MIAQPSLFDAPIAQPYGDLPGYKADGPSREAAAAIKVKVGSLQYRVMATLHATPGLTQPALDRLLGVELGRSARPRVTELKNAGLVEECGFCPGESGIRNTCWQLTGAGERELVRINEAKAERLNAGGASPAVGVAKGGACPVAAHSNRVSGI